MQPIKHIPSLTFRQVNISSAFWSVSVIKKSSSQVLAHIFVFVWMWLIHRVRSNQRNVAWLQENKGDWVILENTSKSKGWSFVREGETIRGFWCLSAAKEPIHNWTNVTQGLLSPQHKAGVKKLLTCLQKSRKNEKKLWSHTTWWSDRERNRTVWK